ncbi:MAG: DUF2092 domain-containing protein [Terrimicrobiaceae bacterium]
MRPFSRQALVTLSLFAASLLSVAAADQNADQILRQMSSTLAAAQTFRFEATREIDAALLPGLGLPGKTRIAALVQRPNKFSAVAVGQAGERRFIANGQTLTLFESKGNFFTTVPMPKTIDALVEELDAKYGFVPPLMDFAVSDPYQEFRRQSQSITHLGRVKIGGGFLGLGAVECDQLLLKGPVASAELWIGVSDHLPRKMVATFHRTGQPQLRIEFLKWYLAAQATAADFSFAPPKGAQKIEMWTTDRMDSALKGTKKP